MKKTLLSLAICAAALLSFTGCKEPPVAPTKSSIVDLRNYKNDGSILAREAEDDITEFSYKIINNVENFDGGEEGVGMSRFQKMVNGEYKMLFPGDAEFEALAKMVSFEDHEDGFKFVFKKSDDYGNIDNWLLLQYVDKYGNRSTAIETDWGELTSQGDFEVVYPLVNPKTKNTFWVMFNDGNPDHYSACLFYEVNTIHGKACVKPMPENYDETKFAEIVEGHILKIKNTIPPKAINVTHSFQLIEQKNDTKAYGPYQNEDGSYDPITKLGGAYNEPISADEMNATELSSEDDELEVSFSIDLAKYLEEGENYAGKIDLSLSEGKPYIFTEFNYTYQLEGFDGYYFSTPAVKPKPVSSEYFKKLAAE